MNDDDSEVEDESGSVQGGESGDLTDVRMDHAQGAGPNGTNVEQSEVEGVTAHYLVVGKAQRLKIQTSLKASSYNSDIIPVWLGEKTEVSKDAVVIQDQDRWTNIVKDGAYNSLEQVPTSVEYTSKAFEHMKQMSESFADAVLEVYNPGDIIWIHEEKLVLVADVLRKKLPSGFICHGYSPINAPPLTTVPLMNAGKLHDFFLGSKKRLLMFDYDGTLTPIVNDPDAALPSGKLLRTLQKLAAKTANKVWIISGRARAFLEAQFGGIDGIGLSAEHGSFVRMPNSGEWKNLADSMNMGWKDETDKVFTDLSAEVEHSWVERKEIAIVWHYRNASDHDYCYAKAVCIKETLEGNLLKRWDVEVMLGKANLEVRPRLLNKGAMVSSLIDQNLAGDHEAFVLCAGDDTTDEDMFRALLLSKLDPVGIFCCLIADDNRLSLASYRLEKPSDLVDAIAVLADMDG